MAGGTKGGGLGSIDMSRSGVTWARSEDSYQLVTRSGGALEPKVGTVTSVAM
jgi:hypothetical protein